MLRKYLFVPPELCINELNAALTGVGGSSKLTENVCLLYTLLCQDLIRLRLRGTPDGYTQVHSATLETIFDKGYKQVITRLLDNRFLEVDHVDPVTGEFHAEGYYSKTAKVARAYRIPSRLRSLERLFKRVPVNEKNPVIQTKLDRLNGVSKDPTVVADFYRQLVMSNMRDLVLLDDAETRSLIAHHTTQRGEVYDDALGSALITKFNDSPLGKPTVCEFAGRVHGKPITTTKELRSRQRYRDALDEPTVELDMVASQPWFLSIVSPALIKKFVPECADAIPFFKAVTFETDVILFKQLCGNANPGEGIYDHLATLWNKRYEDTFTRDQAKAICYRAFFSDYEAKEKSSIAERERKLHYWSKRAAKAQRVADMAARCDSNEAKQRVADAAQLQRKRAESKLFTQKCYELFRDNFHNMWKLFRQIKLLRWDFPRGGIEGSKTVKYYANNALLAQRLEANIVYGVVVKALADAGITRVHTIHDAFVVRAQDEAKSRKIIKRAFKSIGLSPNLKANTKS